MSPKIKKVSLCFYWLFILAFISVPILHILAWLHAPAPIPLLADFGFIIRAIPANVQVLHLDLITCLGGFLISAIPFIAIEFLFYFLIRLFRLYSQGEIFSLQNVTYLKKSGYALLIAQILKPIMEGVMTAVVTWHNPPGLGLRVSVISFTAADFAMICTAFLIILISWIMAEGCRLREEQKLTI